MALPLSAYTYTIGTYSTLLRITLHSCGQQSKQLTQSNYSVEAVRLKLSIQKPCGIWTHRATMQNKAT